MYWCLEPFCSSGSELWLLLFLNCRIISLTVKNLKSRGVCIPGSKRKSSNLDTILESLGYKDLACSLSYLIQWSHSPSKLLTKDSSLFVMKGESGSSNETLNSYYSLEVFFIKKSTRWTFPAIASIVYLKSKPPLTALCIRFSP